MPDAQSTSPLEAPAQRDQPPQEPPPGTPSPSSRVPAWTRGFVALFLIAFVICGVFAIEAWPLTGWKLFSHPRRANLYGWRAYTFDSRGHETKVDFARFPRADRHLPLIMQTYARLSPQRKDAVCRAWAGRMRAFGVHVSGRADLPHARPSAPPPLPPSAAKADPPAVLRVRGREGGPACLGSAATTSSST